LGRISLSLSLSLVIMELTFAERQQQRRTV
jgi:hypothetical protein